MSYPCPHCGNPLAEGQTECGKCRLSIFDKPVPHAEGNVRDAYDQVMFGSLLKKKDPVYFKVAALLIVFIVFVACWGAAAFIIIAEPDFGL